MERNLAPEHTDDRPEHTDTPQRPDAPIGTDMPRHTDDLSDDELVLDCADYTSVGEAVVDAVATATAIDSLEMDPLYFHIDLDALERIIGPKLNGQRRGGHVTVEFQVHRHDIVVNSEGLIHVSEHAR